ncbi:MAG: SusD/RagB family nutrient-binding outer membrane lipoprotein [Bacteroidetes bacterium]|nr:SusD/RagB family nutrient-binding outer membrane lipoprotein [Bacteroidota bacterium]
MKTIIKLSLGIFLVLLVISCTKNFDKINENPNQPAEVSTPTLLTAAMKGLADDIYDEWWSGRQSNLYAQYWCQRTYTDEDRYAIRQNINNQYWRLIYHDVMNLVEIIRLNTDPVEAPKAALYGANSSQIAVATILKVWAMQIMTDTWGNIPYSQAFQGNIDPALSVPNPTYDSQQAIYTAMLKDLENSVAMIDEGGAGFSSGDVIFRGDMDKWRKFANSLRLRIALRMSGTESPQYKTANAILAEVGEDGFMTSNADNAAVAYPGGGTMNSPMYDAFYTSARNDFTTCKTLINMLKGVDDTVNNKINPFKGIIDPRLQIYSRPRSGKYIGMPYGLKSAQNSPYRGKCATWYGNGTYSPSWAIVILNPKFAPVFMEVAEVKFMLSELKGFSQAEYIDGTRASIVHWATVCRSLEGWDDTKFNNYLATMETFLTALPPANKTTVLGQKYLALYNQGYQAWAEYNRTGEPAFLLKPWEISYTDVATGDEFKFEPLIDITTVPKRMTYPQQEYTVNASSVNAAAAALTGGDQMTTKLWWEPQTK